MRLRGVWREAMEELGRQAVGVRDLMLVVLRRGVLIRMGMCLSRRLSGA
jgi:hypothetical protein